MTDEAMARESQIRRGFVCRCMLRGHTGLACSSLTLYKRFGCRESVGMPDTVRTISFDMQCVGDSGIYLNGIRILGFSGTSTYNKCKEQKDKGSSVSNGIKDKGSCCQVGYLYCTSAHSFPNISRPEN